ncbi:class I SAM-dependent methyltransferase [Rhizobium lentis]|uniref:class I SAM-dependent methyltransferase n=1 Tax=Rhizobium lentis TaxID=1138194 RepID=UPI001C83AE46|nr:class I SAM-dependent methyltransferase [Rhizobium lentis]MBX5043616.1 class I SAM-dependent methyltransferase [Rhizobium lentis]
MILSRVSGSFRDPSGHVYEGDEHVYRTVEASAVADYEAARDAGIFSSPMIVSTSESTAPSPSKTAAYLLEHPKIPLISYPYEWAFSMLKEAALLHLDLHLHLLGRGFTLSDSTAYNVQFMGPTPVFIDHLSVRRYSEGEYWDGHRQFCEQFLVPLLLRSFFGISHNAWYRGALEGIAISDFVKMLSFRQKVSWRVLAHLVLQDKFQRSASAERAEKAKHRQLPRNAYIATLQQLRNWIAGLSPLDTNPTTWANYATANTYSDTEATLKKQFIGNFITRSGAATVIDLGCNTGDYSEVALQNGAHRVFGFDFDQHALDSAYHRAKNKSLNLLPLFLDARNQSPSQGWLQAERIGFASRANADAVLALAFEHHLAIAHNIPLEQVVDWITSIAPTGVVEFVPKDDPTVRKMLTLRRDIFPDYNYENFISLIERRARVVENLVVSSTGRTLISYSRNG